MPLRSLRNLPTAYGDQTAYQVRGALDGRRRADIRARGHRVSTDQPVPLGGQDSSPDPAELILFALVGSIIASGASVAQEMGMELRAMDVKVAAAFNQRFRQQTVLAGGYLSQVDVNITFMLETDQPTPRQFQSGVEKSPIANMLQQSGARIL